MNKISIISVAFLLFLGLWGSASAAYDFEYFFGYSLPIIRVANPISSTPTPAPVVVPSVNANSLNSSTLAQISSMQTALRQMSLTLASLNSNLAKSNFGIENPVNNFSKVVVAKGIPLLLPEEIKKEEQNTKPSFASLIPPDVKNFPWVVTSLVVLILALFGAISYLIFLRRQEKQQVKRF